MSNDAEVPSNSRSASGPEAGCVSPFDAELQARLLEVTHRLTYAEVSRRTGFHRESCRRYLLHGHPPVEFMAALSEALEVSLHWLLLGIGPCKRDDRSGDWVRAVKPADLLMEVGRRWRGMQASLTDVQARLARLERAFQAAPDSLAS